VTGNDGYCVMMTIQAVPAGSLSDNHLSAWTQLQSAEALFESPHLRPEFTQAVASVRNDIEVAIVAEDEQPVAFLPFQRTPWNGGRAAGGWLSNYQALVKAQGVDIDPVELLKACRLSSWKFDHLLAAPETFSPFVARETDSPFVDLSDGYEAYAAWLKRRGKALVESERKARKMAREIGPITFEAHSTDRSLLSTMIEWKSAQYLRTKERDIFEADWVRSLLFNILDRNDIKFSPLLSVLRTGDQIACISYALRSGSVLHGWFMAYNNDLARFSPGTQMLVEIIKYAPTAGIRRFDLGKGPESYKRQFMNGANRIVEGAVDTRTAASLARRAFWRTRDWIRSSPLYRPAQTPIRIMRRARGWLEMR
jgi:CelD/BcsL family acetyltransferase involved in cellulose biosynthesis